MTELNDNELLAQYASTQSETAFSTLVARYVNLVYSAALRFTNNPHHAQEITAFIILSRKAGSLGSGTVLSGWLYETARLTACNFVKGEIRRQQREQEAYMQSTLNEPEVGAAWEKIAPFLDEAMGRLGGTDRDAIVLRFFENKTTQEIAHALNLNESAAHKRVSRALEKLRKYFVKRGVTLSAALIAGAVTANSVQAAPAGVAVSVTAVTVNGAAVSTTMTTIIKGTMKMMTWIKLKFAVGVSMGILLAGGIATMAISQTGSGNEPTAKTIAAKTRDAYAALSSYSDSGSVVSDLAGQKNTTYFNIRLQRPNLYRIEWFQQQAFVTNEGFVWSAGKGDFYQITASDFLVIAARQKKKAGVQAMPNMKAALSQASAISASIASTIPGAFFNDNFGDLFVLPSLSGLYSLNKEKDEMIGGVDCYVLSSDAIGDKNKPGAASTKVWIAKKDFLIRKSSTRYTEKADNKPDPKLIDETIKKTLEMQNKPATPEAIAAMRPQVEEAMKQVQSTLKKGFSVGMVFTQTHDDISVNKTFSPTDFDVVN